MSLINPWAPGVGGTRRERERGGKRERGRKEGKERKGKGRVDAGREGGTK